MFKVMYSQFSFQAARSYLAVEASDVSWTRVTLMILEIITWTSIMVIDVCYNIVTIDSLAGQTTLGCIILALTEVYRRPEEGTIII